MKSKKALSEIVITILIVLIAIAAVVTLWTALKPQVQSGAEQAGKAQECFFLKLNIEKVSYNDTTKQVAISIKRDKGKAELTRIALIADGSQVATDKISSPEVLKELETKTYLVNVTAKPSKIEIAGVLKGDELCSVSDTSESGEIL